LKVVLPSSSIDPYVDKKTIYNDVSKTKVNRFDIRLHPTLLQRKVSTI